jgi:hypothetical protein
MSAIHPLLKLRTAIGGSSAMLHWRLNVCKERERTLKSKPKPDIPATIAQGTIITSPKEREAGLCEDCPLLRRGDRNWRATSSSPIALADVTPSAQLRGPTRMPILAVGGGLAAKFG